MNDYSRYLKIPWKDKGRDFSGCDCWGWARLFANYECGLAIKDISYSSCKNVHELQRIAGIEQQKWCTIDLSDVRKGDFVDLSREGRDYHIGVMVTDKLIGHLEVNAFPVLVNKNSFKIRNRIKGVWRYVG